ncbi:MATE family efflux transporter [Dorea formicigenerans]|uniref:MATE family efflux transporter n=1 Tax=Dorea formicigenerans TaxID=39486 RepID=UPI001D009FF6|nr:MATE family efflux transporter [Dorea formicigenerans]MCB5502584.1 polysaccharide biosynthesis C-terminal domain-containing protein [Dorea formicigenerans]
MRNNRLLNTKLNKYVIPGIMMSLALQLGNIVDTVFVSNLIGVEAMSAVTMSLPVETIVQLTGYCLGIGGSIAVGNMLGKRDKEGASKLFSVTFFVTLMVGILFVFCAFPTAGPIARFLVHGGGMLTDYTRDYIRISMLGAPVIGIGLLMVNYLGVENHPELASLYLILANAINLILDYIFLRFTPLGITGASLSTVLGFLFAMVVFVCYIRSDKRNLRFVRLKAGEIRIIKEAVVTGVPMLIFMAANFVKAFGLNTIIMHMIGEDGMAVFTVCDNVLLIVEMLTGGIIGVIPNVAGILFGEKDYVGIRVLCKKMLRYSYIMLAVIFVIIMLFTEQITILFGSGGGELGKQMVSALRIFALCVIPYLWNKFITSYYESIEETAIASFVTLLENAAVVLPATFVGIYLWKQVDGSGINGIAAGFVATEIITVIAAWIFRKSKHKNTSFYIVPDKNPGINLDFSIRSTMDEAVVVHKKIVEFCREKNISSNKANLAAVCAEEMTVNIIKFGGKTSNWIDINLCLEEDVCRLRIRDNGVNFNPLEYNQDSEEFDIHGIELVKKISRSMDYIRAIDMNNTIISF